MSFGAPILLDASLFDESFQPDYQMYPQNNMGQGMQFSNGLPPSPERSGPPTLSPSLDTGAEGNAQPPAAYINASVTPVVLTPPQDQPQRSDNSTTPQSNVQTPQSNGKQNRSIYVFQPPMPIDLDGMDTLAAMWCKLEPEGQGQGPSPANVPFMCWTNATPTPSQPQVDQSAWTQHEEASNSTTNEPLSGFISDIIASDWAMQSANLTPTNNNNNGYDALANSNFQRTLAPTPTWTGSVNGSAQPSPMDPNFQRESPLRPTAWYNNGLMSPNNGQSSAVPRNVSGPYMTNLSVDPNGFLFNGRFLNDITASEERQEDQKELVVSDMVGPPTGYPQEMAQNAQPNQINRPSVTVGPIPPRILNRARQVAGKY